jgi:hypothetical protein
VVRQLTSLDAQFLAFEDGRNHGHVLSYRGALDLGVVGDRDLVPDAWALIADVYSELAALRGLLIPIPLEA